MIRKNTRGYEEDLNERPDPVITEVDVEDEDTFPEDGAEVISAEAFNEFFSRYGLEDDEISGIDVDINITTGDGETEETEEVTDDGAGDVEETPATGTEAKKNKVAAAKKNKKQSEEEEEEEEEVGEESFLDLFSMEDEEFNDESTDTGDTSGADTGGDDSDIDVDININVNVDDGTDGGGDEEPVEEEPATDDGTGGEEPAEEPATEPAPAEGEVAAEAFAFFGLEDEGDIDVNVTVEVDGETEVETSNDESTDEATDGGDDVDLTSETSADEVEEPAAADTETAGGESFNYRDLII